MKILEKLTGETRPPSLRRIDAKALEEVRAEWREAAQTRPWPEERSHRVPFLWRRIGRMGGGGL